MDRIVTHGAQREAEAGVAQPDHEQGCKSEDDDCDSVGEAGCEDGRERDAIGPLGDIVERGVGDDVIERLRASKARNGEIGARKTQERAQEQAEGKRSRRRDHHARAGPEYGDPSR